MISAQSDVVNSPDRNWFIVDVLQEKGGYWDTEWNVGGMECRPFEDKDFSVGHNIHAGSAARAT
jgi:hypothetical protein